MPHAWLSNQVWTYNPLGRRSSGRPRKRSSEDKKQKKKEEWRVGGGEKEDVEVEGTEEDTQLFLQFVFISLIQSRFIFLIFCFLYSFQFIKYIYWSYYDLSSLQAFHAHRHFSFIRTIITGRIIKRNRNREGRN